MLLCSLHLSWEPAAFLVSKSKLPLVPIPTCSYLPPVFMEQSQNMNDRIVSLTKLGRGSKMVSFSSPSADH